MDNKVSSGLQHAFIFTRVLSTCILLAPIYIANSSDYISHRASRISHCDVFPRQIIALYYFSGRVYYRVKFIVEETLCFERFEAIYSGFSCAYLYTAYQDAFSS
jgi:hypothetical protein